MSNRVLGLLALALAVVVLLWPLSLCRPNSVWPEHGDSPTVCSTPIPTFLAIQSGWPVATPAMLLTVGLVTLGIWLLGKKDTQSTLAEYLGFRRDNQQRVSPQNSNLTTSDIDRSID